MVHRRQVGSDTLILGNQGALFGNAMTWWDHDTGSVWSQPIGEAIAGPRKGQRLETLPVEFTTWGAWKDAHPDTLALQADGKPSGFALKDFLIVLSSGDDTRGWRVPDVQQHGVINDVVDGQPVAVVSDPTNEQRWSVFSRQVGDTVVDLEIVSGTLQDSVTGTTFDPVRGFGTSGALGDETLELLPGFTSFPDDFDTFWPDGSLWSVN